MDTSDICLQSKNKTIEETHRTDWWLVAKLKKSKPDWICRLFTIGIQTRFFYTKPFCLISGFWWTGATERKTEPLRDRIIKLCWIARLWFAPLSHACRLWVIKKDPLNLSGMVLEQFEKDLQWPEVGFQLWILFY